eukprot:CAMPEP_0167784158 /NCGR_PEP_ID=MMETSP0111_2-20121227/7480_1 /TAXON_ID=91324 /ORGANISM="Lotharella globosa, Strain CCCM811" /LENGTH=490 /DNA_ID=CAMNT_0007675195 /DNA_START=139 /DNA_END=1608 /DNA_ORIENTATION=-
MEYFKVKQIHGWGPTAKFEDRFLRVTAKHFEFWKSAQQTGNYELKRICEVKRTKPDRIQILMDFKYSKEKRVDIQFQCVQDANNFKDILALNQDKDERLGKKNRAIMRALKKKYMELSNAERSVLMSLGDEEMRRKFLERQNKPHHKKLPATPSMSENSLFNSNGNIKETGVSMYDLLARTPTAMSSMSSIEQLGDNHMMDFPDLKLTEKKLKQVGTTRGNFLRVSTHKLLFDTKHPISDVMVLLSIIGADGTCRSAVNQTQQLRFAPIDQEKHWDDDDCTFQSWDCTFSCGDTLLLRLMQDPTKSKKKVKELGTCSKVLGVDIENYTQIDMWMDFINAKNVHKAYIQVQITFGTERTKQLEKILANEMKWGVKVGGRKEEKLLNKNPMLIVKLIGGVEMAPHTLVHMVMVNSKGKAKSKVLKSQPHDPETQFGSENVFKHWGGNYERGDAIEFTLIKRRPRMGAHGKFKGKVVLKESIDFKRGFSTSLW